MFDKIRNGIKDSIFIKILMGLMIISFGIFGIGDFIGTGGLAPNIAVKVGDREITTSEFQRRFDVEYGNFTRSLGGQVAQTEAMRRSVANAVVQEVTRSSTVDAAAQELGIVVSDAQLREMIRRQTIFHDSNGAFSQAIFANTLANNNLTEAAYLDFLREQVRQDTLLQPMVLGIAPPDYYVDSLFAYRAEGRLAETLLVPTAGITLSAAPSDDDLKALYDQNTPSFMRPEYRKLSAIAIRPSDLVKPESLDEEELRAYYRDNATRFQIPARRHLQQLIFDNREQADQARGLAAPGDTLAALATKTRRELIDLGELDANSVLAKTIGAAFSLPVGEISQPVQTDLGWHIFTVVADIPAKTQSFEEAHDAIRTIVAEEKGLDAVYRASTELQDALAAGTPMRDIAANLGVDVIEIEAVDQTGKDPKGEEVPNIIDRAKFLSTAFTTPAGGDSGLLDLPPNGGYYVVKVEGITPPAARSLEEVRPQLVAMWERGRRMEQARAQADKIAAEIGASTKFPDLQSKDQGVTYAEIGPLTRAGQSMTGNAPIDRNRVSAQMLQKLFAAKPGDVFTADVGDGIVIARLTKIVAPEAIGPLAQERIQLVGSLRNAIGTDILDQMTNSFAEHYPVDVNQTVIDQLVATRR